MMRISSLMRQGRIPAVLACAAAFATASLLASQVRLIDLEQMTQRAGRIFSGRCTGTSVEFDERLGHDVMVATFKVHRAVKGVTGDTVTLRMMTGASTAADTPAGVPTYSKGEDVVLFLYGENAQGISSPVGLGQGRFKVLTDKQGRRIALNDFANRNLLTGMRPEARARIKARGEAGLQRGDAAQRGEAALQRAEAAHRDDVDPADLLDVAEALVTTEK
jgi:hypothetical protein